MRTFAWPIDDEATIRPFTVEDAEALYALVDTNRERLGLSAREAADIVTTSMSIKDKGGGHSAS